MKIMYDLSLKLLSPFVTIHAARQDAHTDALAQAIQQAAEPLTVIGRNNKRRRAIPIYAINRCYHEGKAVYCELVDDSERYQLTQPIYQLAEILPTNLFLRVSQSEIIRIAFIKDFSLTKAGMYQVNLRDGSTTFASRRYTQKLRKDVLK